MRWRGGVERGREVKGWNSEAGIEKCDIESRRLRDWVQGGGEVESGRDRDEVEKEKATKRQRKRSGEK